MSKNLSRNAGNIYAKTADGKFPSVDEQIARASKLPEFVSSNPLICEPVGDDFQIRTLVQITESMEYVGRFFGSVAHAYMIVYDEENNAWSEEPQAKGPICLFVNNPGEYVLQMGRRDQIMNTWYHFYYHSAFYLDRDCLIVKTAKFGVCMLLSAIEGSMTRIHEFLMTLRHGSLEELLEMDEKQKHNTLNFMNLKKTGISVLNELLPGLSQASDYEQEASCSAMLAQLAFKDPAIKFHSPPVNISQTSGVLKTRDIPDNSVLRPKTAVLPAAQLSFKDPAVVHASRGAVSNSTVDVKSDSNTPSGSSKKDVISGPVSLDPAVLFRKLVQSHTPAKTIQSSSPRKEPAEPVTTTSSVKVDETASPNPNVFDLEALKNVKAVRLPPMKGPKFLQKLQTPT